MTDLEMCVEIDGDPITTAERAELTLDTWSGAELMLKGRHEIKTGSMVRVLTGLRREDEVVITKGEFNAPATHVTYLDEDDKTIVGLSGGGW